MKSGTLFGSPAIIEGAKSPDHPQIPEAALVVVQDDATQDAKQPAVHSPKQPRGIDMRWRHLLAGLFAIAGAARAESITLHVTLKLTDDQYRPLAGQSVRLAFSGQDWQAPTAGERVVTDAKGEATLTAVVAIEGRLQSQPIGMTPFSVPVGTDHLLIAAELERVLPLDGHDHAFRWLYVENVFRRPDGSTSGGYIDAIYAKGAKGRFDRPLEPNLGTLKLADRRDPDERAIAGDEGWVPTDFLLDRDDTDKAHPRWTLSLAFKRMPRPVWR